MSILRDAAKGPFLGMRGLETPKSGDFLPTEKAILTDGFLFYANSPVWAYRPAQASRSGD
jgi:hypothetical protein